MMAADVKVNLVREDTNRIKTLIGQQKAIMKDFQTSIGRMEGNWSGESYGEYVNLFNSISPGSLSMLTRLEELNNSIVKLVDNLEKTDQQEGKAIQNIF